MKRSLFLLVMILSMTFVASCSRSTKFSTVMEGGFDPVAAFRQQGYTIQAETRGEGVRNAEYGYGWQSWCGVLSEGEKRPECSAIAVLIRDALNQSLSGGSHDELTVGPPRSDGQPISGMLRYNKNDVHGDMHVWLMPDATTAAVSYVIFVKEERLK
ncbi:MAG: hypothetical protein WCJ09_05150 [Planctomycetota bacterium]